MKQLRLSTTLTIPTDAVTQTFAILGKRGSGKTTTATVLTEELLDAGHHVVVIDPLDVTWGLRSSRDGKSAGYPITVLGGDHADLPLEATAGAVLADFVVEHHSPVILSLRHFSMADQRRFVTDFCEKLYALKGQTANRVPLHLVIDEADEFAPQRIPSGHERMFGAIDRIVRRGRSAGLGVTLISQRAAVLNKDVLSQAEVLICHQTISPQDRKALEAWIQAHDAHGQAATFMGSLASLARGEAWVWSPGWLDVFQRVAIRDRKTFDSSATPKGGVVAEQPKRLALVDLDALRTKIASTIEKAKADDPKALRAEIAGLRKELASKHPAAAPVVERVEVPAVSDKRVQELLGLVQRAEVVVTSLHDYAGQLRSDLTKVIQAKAAPPRNLQSAIARPAPVVRKLVAPVNGHGDASVSPARQKILNGLAFLHGIGVAPADKTQLALIVGVSPTSGGYFNNLGALRSMGLIEYPSGGTVALTDAGHKVASTDGVPSTTDELHEAIRGKLPPAKWRILEVLIQAYPKPRAKDDLAVEIGVSPTSGGYFNNLGSLRSLGLVAYPTGGMVAATPVLFLEGA